MTSGSSLGPAISRDAGRTWRWLNADGRRHEPANAFDYAFAADENETRFAVSIPYSQKDYPTKAHIAALEKLGPCPEHRRSFGPVSQLTLPLSD